MSEALKPCPFCGGAGDITTSECRKRLYIIECQDCGAEVGFCESPELTLEVWNRRSSPWIESAKQEPPKAAPFLAQWKRLTISCRVLYWDTVDPAWTDGRGVFSMPDWWMPIPPLEGK